MDQLTKMGQFEVTNATEQVFQTLYSAIITLELPPGTKVSEAEIAKRLGVSRQPVRDAFYRLSEQGVIRIRPQRATVITQISEQALLDARFIRTAIEVECIRAAAEKITDAGIAKLEKLLEQQTSAIESDERLDFHKYDDAFHHTICEIAGHPDAWKLIRQQKLHMDRVRYLSLALGAQSAFEDHKNILDCLIKRDGRTAEALVRLHLSKILQILEQVRNTHPEYFE